MDELNGARPKIRNSMVLSVARACGSSFLGRDSGVARNRPLVISIGACGTLHPAECRCAMHVLSLIYQPTSSPGALSEMKRATHLGASRHKHASHRARATTQTIITRRECACCSSPLPSRAPLSESAPQTADHPQGERLSDPQLKMTLWLPRQWRPSRPASWVWHTKHVALL